MKNRKKKTCFLSNNHAVLGLPMRLTISLVIGTVVLLTILSYILNPCLFPNRMQVSVTPYLSTVPSNNPTNLTFLVFVNETDGHPLSGASVIIKGLGGAGAGFSDDSGKVLIQIQVQLSDGLSEGYLDISVKAPCHVTYEYLEMIKVVKTKK